MQLIVLNKPRRRFSVLAKLAFWVVLMGTSCSKGGDSTSLSNSVVDLNNGVFVVNQGAYLSYPGVASTGTITFFNKSNASLTQDLFNRINSRALGDNILHMAKGNKRFYITVANQNRIEVADSGSFASSAIISGLNVPSFCLPFSSTKAYVTEYNSLTSGANGSVAVVNLTTQTVTSRLDTGPFPRKIIAIGNLLYVQYSTSVTSPTLTVINTANDQLVNNLSTSLVGATDMITDGNGKLWVALQGSPAHLVRVNASTGAIEITIDMPGNFTAQINALALNDVGTKIYALTTTGVYEVVIATQAITLISGKKYNAIGYDPIQNLIYCGTDNGTLAASAYRYSGSTRNFNDSIKVGVKPNLFLL